MDEEERSRLIKTANIGLDKINDQFVCDASDDICEGLLNKMMPLLEKCKEENDLVEASLLLERLIFVHVRSTINMLEHVSSMVKLGDLNAMFSVVTALFICEQLKLNHDVCGGERVQNVETEPETVH